MYKDTISLRQVEYAVRAGTVLTSLLNRRTVFLHRLFGQFPHSTHRCTQNTALAIPIQFVKQIEIELPAIQIVIREFCIIHALSSWDIVVVSVEINRKERVEVNESNTFQ